MKKNKGITLMELLIVLAIIVIVAAIAVPVFLLTTDRSRLRADIQSANVIQNAMDLYRIERRRTVAGANIDDMLQNLVTAEYINARNIRLQTEGAAWHLHATYGLMVNITDSPEEVHAAYRSLPDDEREQVFGGRATAP